MIEGDMRDTIVAPIHRVFGRLVAIGRYSEWRAGRGGIFLRCRQDSAGPVARGTAYTDRTRLGTARGEVVAFEPPRRIVFHYSARWVGLTVIEGWPGYLLTPAGHDRTVVNHHAEARTLGLLRLFEPVIQRVAEHERRRTMNALKGSFQ